MKKRALILAVFAILLMGLTTVSAQSEIPVVLDGVPLSFDQPPIIINDRVMVPVRKIFEALNHEVTWDEENRAVFVPGKFLLYIDDYYAHLPDESIPLDVPATIINDRTLVPLRFVSEQCGAIVEWLENTEGDKYVKITTKQDVPTITGSKGNIIPCYTDTVVPDFGLCLGYSPSKNGTINYTLRYFMYDSVSIDDSDIYTNIIKDCGFTKIGDPIISGNLITITYAGNGLFLTIDYNTETAVLGISIVELPAESNNVDSTTTKNNSGSSSSSNNINSDLYDAEYDALTAKYNSDVQYLENQKQDIEDKATKDGQAAYQEYMRASNPYGSSYSPTAQSVYDQKIQAIMNERDSQIDAIDSQIDGLTKVYNAEVNMLKKKHGIK